MVNLNRSACPSEGRAPASSNQTYQFDWNHEVVVLGGVTTAVKVAHLRLCHSRMFFVRGVKLGRRLRNAIFCTWHGLPFAIMR